MCIFVNILSVLFRDKRGKCKLKNELNNRQMQSSLIVKKKTFPGNSFQSRLRCYFSADLVANIYWYTLRYLPIFNQSPSPLPCVHSVQQKVYLLGARSSSHCSWFGTYISAGMRSKPGDSGEPRSFVLLAERINREGKNKNRIASYSLRTQSFAHRNSLAGMSQK